jgi:hypothetical protein
MVRPTLPGDYAHFAIGAVLVSENHGPYGDLPKFGALPAMFACSQSILPGRKAPTHVPLLIRAPPKFEVDTFPHRD